MSFIQEEIDSLKDYLEELDRSIADYSDNVRNIDDGLLNADDNADQTTGINQSFLSMRRAILVLEIYVVFAIENLTTIRCKKSTFLKETLTR